MSDKLPPYHIQRIMNSLTTHNNAIHRLQKQFHAHCEEVYGCIPEAVDHDSYIDLCMGGCLGEADFYPYIDFHKEMLRILASRDMRLPNGQDPIEVLKELNK